jgi:5'-nucleotidase
MNYNRRVFIKTLGSAVLVAGASIHSLEAFVMKEDVVKLTILHTNDVHSRIEAFPMNGSALQGLGGAAKRAQFIQKIRNTEQHTLLLDSGDMLQGTPYFNFFGGELEFKLMSQMKYDAATLGNHDFDGGIDSLKEQLKHANFQLINANYDFKNTVLKEDVKPYQIFQKGAIKVGVLGVGIELAGLVPKDLYKETQYLDPIQEANKIAHVLKNEEECDLVICLSHLGFKYENNKVDDLKLASQSENIDVILGGHTHTFLEKPEIVQNKKNQPVAIHQVGWAGIALGRLDIYFERTTKKYCIGCKNTWIK